MGVDGRAKRLGKSSWLPLAGFEVVEHYDLAEAAERTQQSFNVPWTGPGQWIGKPSVFSAFQIIFAHLSIFLRSKFSCSIII